MVAQAVTFSKFMNKIEERNLKIKEEKLMLRNKKEAIYKQCRRESESSEKRTKL